MGDFFALVFCAELTLEAFRKMPAPKPKCSKRLSMLPDQSSSSGTPTPSPYSPAALSVAPSTPQGDGRVEEPAPKKPRRQPKDQSTLTPLEKGRDMAQKLLKKKSDSSQLALTLQPLPYGEALKTEMDKFSRLFECPGCTRLNLMTHFFSRTSSPYDACGCCLGSCT